MNSQRIFFLSTVLLIAPILAHADFIAPPTSTPTFENQQNLTLRIQNASSGSEVVDTGSYEIQISTSTSFSYAIGHMPLWPNRNASSEGNDELFDETLDQNKLYLELWSGEPFTSDAHMLQNWDITNAPTGQVSATLPAAGAYFFVAYLPDAFYQDPQAMCPTDTDWETDCAPSYTLEQMRGYFNSSLTSDEPFPYAPDAFGGIAFTVSLPTTPQPDSNVLFIPGIEGSRLYTRNSLGIEETLWEPSILNTLSKLSLGTDGSSDHKIYTRDIVDYLYDIPELGDVYGPFEKFMDSLVTNGMIRHWQAYPYDWRYDVEDIVSNGTLVGTPTGPLSKVYLQDVVQSLASSSPTGKVTIIAHSNGGLLAKALAIDLQNKGKINLIDKIILIGSPQLGTPTTIGALLNGDGQTDDMGGLVMYGGNVRAAAATMPGMYGLLPSAKYLSYVAGPLISFPVNTLNNLYEKYFGADIHTFQELENFVTDSGNIRANFPPNDLHTPLALTSSIFQKEINTHSILDSWIPPTGVTLTAISGWGNLTPYAYTYQSSDKKSIDCYRTDPLTGMCEYSYQVHHTTLNTNSGDNTVVSPSAIALAPNSFYFNAKTFSADKLGTIGHGDLTSADPIQHLIKNLLANVSSAIPYISTTTPTYGTNPLTVVSVHSPVNISAQDAEGNKTGIYPVPGHPGIYYVKESIPGSSIQILDEEKYVYLPENESYTISLQGYDTGETTVDMGTTNNNGTPTTSEEFTDIPTTASTTVEFSIENSANSSAVPVFPSVLQIDVFGDGTTTAIEASPESSTTSATSSENVGRRKRILSLLTKAATFYSLGNTDSKRFLTVLTKIQNSSTTLDTADNILNAEKIVQKLIGIQLSVAQATFFMQFLTSLAF